MNKIYLIVISAALLLLTVCAVLIRQHYMVPKTESLSLFELKDSLGHLFVQNDTSSSIKVVYFWQARCPCDEYIKPHFLSMKKRYQQQGHNNIDFYIAPVGKAYTGGQQTQEAHHIPGLGSIPILPKELLQKVAKDIHLTPSVAIWSAEGKLSYYGPHNLGYLCTDDTSFVKKVLDRLLSGEGFSPLDVIGDGCFCKVSHS